MASSPQARETRLRLCGHPLPGPIVGNRKTVFVPPESLKDKKNNLGIALYGLTTWHRVIFKVDILLPQTAGVHHHIRQTKQNKNLHEYKFYILLNFKFKNLH